MVKLKSRTQCPVGGFMFTQAQTGAKFQTWSFDELCGLIRSHRLANPRFGLATDPAAIAAEVDLTNATRMQSIPGADIYITSDEALPKLTPRPRPSAAAAVAGARKVAAGVGVLLEWLGSGGVPVPQEAASYRASICAKCPKNKPGDLTSWFTVPASNLLKRQLEVRGDMKLATPYDDQLGVCEACACPLKLKVHTGLEHVLKHLTEQVKSELVPNCWILTTSKGK